MPAGDAASVVGPDMVGKTSAPIEEFQKARTARLYPGISRMSRITRGRDRAIDETCQTVLEPGPWPDVHLREGDHIVVMAAPVRRCHAQCPTLRAYQGTAFEFRPLGDAGCERLEARFHQGKKLEV